MAKRKATHKGTCQVCGRVQKLPYGRLSKHGYVHKGYGFFVGTCPGAEERPLEEDKSLTLQTVQALTEHAGYLETSDPPTVTIEQRRALQIPVANDLASFTAEFKRHFDVDDKVAAYEFDKAVKTAELGRSSEAKWARKTAAQLLELAATVHGRNVQPV